MRSSHRPCAGSTRTGRLLSLLLGVALCGALMGCGMGGAADTGSAALSGGEGSPGTPSAELTIATEALPAGQPNHAYPSTTLTASNANGTVVWSVAQGTLPSGLSLSPAGVLSGTPSSTGFETVTIRAQSGGTAATRTYALSIGVFGLTASSGLFEGTAWSGQPVALLAGGAVGQVTFQVVRNDSGGSFSAASPSGSATWLPGPSAGGGRYDRIAAVDAGSGERAELAFDVEANPAAHHVASFGSTDVWYVDPNVKAGTHAYATDFQAVLARTGLRAAASTSRQGSSADRVAEMCVRLALLRHLNLFYGRNSDGSRGQGLPVSFPFAEPSGYERPTPGSWLPGASNRYSVIAVVEGSRSGVLGTAFADGSTNALHENDTTTTGAGELGVFANQCLTTFNLTYNNYDLKANPVSAADLPALQALLYGRPDAGGRWDTLRTIIDGLGRTIASVTAHEIGHSLGLAHTNPSTPGSIMNGTGIIAPQATYAFTASDYAALSARLPGVGRFGGAAKRGTSAATMPEGGIAVCGAPRERCDLALAPAGCACAAHVRQGLPTWAVRVP